MKASVFVGQHSVMFYLWLSACSHERAEFVSKERSRADMKHARMKSYNALARGSHAAAAGPNHSAVLAFLRYRWPETKFTRDLNLGHYR
jgi:hypothetical protein